MPVADIGWITGHKGGVWTTCQRGNNSMLESIPTYPDAIDIGIWLNVIK